MNTFAPTELMFAVRDDHVFASLDMPYQPDQLGEAFKQVLARGHSSGTRAAIIDGRCFGPTELTLKLLASMEVTRIYQAFVKENDFPVAFLVTPEHLGPETPAEELFRDAGIPLRVFHDLDDALHWLSTA